VRISDPAAVSRLAFRLRLRASGCGPFEWLTLGYLALLNFLILAFRHNLPGALFFVAAHTAVAATIVALCCSAAPSAFPALLFLRHWYPMLLFLGFFEELHYLVHLVYPGWFDAVLIRFDYALFGVHPTLWFESFATPSLNDAMQFAYMTYYLYAVVLGAALYARGESASFWRLMTASAAAYYFGYVFSIFFPVEGPYHTLAALHRVELAGGPFTSLMNFIESWGRVHGAAFPSAHVSGSFVALLAAWRYRRRWFWIFLPSFLAMLVATVYGRYHYAADVFAGLITGWIGWCFAVYFFTAAPARSTERSGSSLEASVTSSTIGVTAMYPRTNAHTSVPSSSSSSGRHLDQKYGRPRGLERCS
jgi:membrane-associated phospholipid phosphatase